MKITRRQLRRIVETFAATAEEEAEKVNAQTGISLVTDQAFWEEMGVSTGEELAKSLLSSTYSDYYKDLHGIRPRWMADKIKSMSVEEIQTLIDDLDKEAETMVADEKWEEENLPGWEDEMIAAVKAHPEDVPEEYLEYETLPQQTGMGRRTEGIMRITRRQLRRIIREAIDPREMEEPVGGYVGNALHNDPDYYHHTDTSDALIDALIFGWAQWADDNGQPDPGLFAPQEKGDAALSWVSKNEPDIARQINALSTHKLRALFDAAFDEDADRGHKTSAMDWNR